MKKILEELRKLFPHGHEKFTELCFKEMELHSKKNHDYASGGHPLGNLYREAKILSLYPGLKVDDPVTVTAVHLLKQLDALLWMHSNGHSAQVEGPLERCQDISVYAKIIALIIGENPLRVESAFDPWNPDSYAEDGFSPKKDSPCPPVDESLRVAVDFHSNVVIGLVYPCKGCGNPPEYQEEKRLDGNYHHFRCVTCHKAVVSLVGKKDALKQWNEVYSTKGSQEKIFSG